jgi:gamma-glutamyltranspeptidase / glutathione hydrolase
MQTARITGERYRSRRSVVMTTRGVVASSQPLASQAGLRMLLAGGSAADAAIAAAAVLNVVEPMSTGIGGDAWALVYDAKTGRVRALNGSGRAPQAISLAAFAERGLASVPATGMLSVTVPGAVDAWATLLAAHGRMTLADVLQPAIQYAEQGFPVSEIIARGWQNSTEKLRQHSDASRTFLPQGRAPRAGEVFYATGLGRSFRQIAEGGRDAFYTGDIAKAIIATSEHDGGYFTLDDLASHRSEWVEPIATNYRGHTIYECPPNGQGLTALLALNTLEGFDLAGLAPASPESLHLMIEAMRLAFADAAQYIADPQHANVPTAYLLSAEHTSARRSLINHERAAASIKAGVLPGGHDTVYLSVVDAEGNAVSFINSLYMGFGSGIIAGDTGIALQNRGAGFVLDPAHPNCLAPGKRPYHTIIPCMATKNGQLFASFGVMGGFMQPQGHVQMVVNMLDYGMNPQEALDAPRFELVEPYLQQDQVSFEHDAEVIAALARMGHQVVPVSRPGGFGGGQIIMVDEAGVRHAGSDPRKDGCAVAY